MRISGNEPSLVNHTSCADIIVTQLTVFSRWLVGCG